MDTASLGDPQVRGHIYGVLSRSFTYPDEELVAVLLRRGVLLELFWGLSQVLDTCRTSLAQMSRWVCDTDGAALLEQLSIDYTRLFVTGMPRVIAPPYESVYLNQGLLMGDAVSGVLSAYREAGLAIQDSYVDLPDHLSAELEFMQYLARAEEDASGDQDAGLSAPWQDHQRCFLAEHLGRWAPECLTRASTGAETPFYRLVSGITLKFLEWDATRLAATASPVTTED